MKEVMGEKYQLITYKGIETIFPVQGEAVRLVHIPRGTSRLEFRMLVDEIVSNGERIVGVSY